MKEKFCIYCSNRMSCDKYLTWLSDPKNIWVPRAMKCERYEEREEIEHA